jgi:hypothetical protein
MKYSLDLDAPLTDEIRRIALGRLATAATVLKEQPDGLDNAVHIARRYLKQCRALYRLVRSEAKSFQKDENARLGHIGRQLSSLRDAKALIEATDYLRREIPTRSNSMLMDRLSKRLDRRRVLMSDDDGGAGKILASAAHNLVAAAAALSELELPHSSKKSAACLGRGWDGVSERARQAIDAASDGGMEGFHDLRKRVQDRWMQASLIKGAWPTAMTAIQRQGKYLSDQLGHAQDLDILLRAIDGSEELVSDTVETEAIREAAQVQLDTLQSRCLERAREFFAPSAPSDGEMIERLLRQR